MDDVSNIIKLASIFTVMNSFIQYLLSNFIFNNKIEKIKSELNFQNQKQIEKFKNILELNNQTIKFQHQLNLGNFGLFSTRKHDAYNALNVTMFDILDKIQDYELSFFIKGTFSKDPDIEKRETASDLLDDLKSLLRKSQIYLSDNLYREINIFRDCCMVLCHEQQFRYSTQNKVYPEEGEDYSIKIQNNEKKANICVDNILMMMKTELKTWE